MTLVRRAVAQGYNVKLLFFWLNSPELAVRRVAERVAKGGHNIPEDVIRRRYVLGINNLFNLFASEVDYWEIYDNSEYPAVQIAMGGKGEDIIINNMLRYKRIKEYVK